MVLLCIPIVNFAFYEQFYSQTNGVKVKIAIGTLFVDTVLKNLENSPLRQSVHRLLSHRGHVNDTLWAIELNIYFIRCFQVCVSSLNRIKTDQKSTCTCATCFRQLDQYFDWSIGMDKGFSNEVLYLFKKGTIFLLLANTNK